MPELATEKMTIEFSPSTGQVMGTTDVNDLAVTHIPAPTAAAKDTVLCVGQLAFAFSAAMPCPCQFPGHTFVAGGGSLMATAQKAMSGNQQVLMKDDMGFCAGSWMTNTTTPAPVPCSCQVKISDAGQAEVIGS